MKTPMQELIDEMQKSPLMFASALALIEQMRMLKKEKEVMIDFADDSYEEIICESNLGNITHDNRIEAINNVYNETFNTKEK